jgi:hypothetical protein
MRREDWIHDWRELAASVPVPEGSIHIVDSWVVGTPPPPRPEPRAVPLMAKVANFTSAVAAHVAAGLPQASKVLAARRLAICDGCENYRPSDKTCGGISGCGCYVGIKANWRDQSCPLNKWPNE